VELSFCILSANAQPLQGYPLAIELAHRLRLKHAGALGLLIGHVRQTFGSIELAHLAAVAQLRGASASARQFLLDLLALMCCGLVICFRTLELLADLGQLSLTRLEG
jgi:hypothetical protein